MDQQEPKPFKEEIIEIIADFKTEREEQSLDEEQSIQDQLIPRPAFQIDLNNQNLTEEQKDAMSYLLAVRNQKQSLVCRNKIKANQSKQKLHTPQLNIQMNDIRIPKNDIENQVQLIEYQINEWKREHISNWRCVVSNMQFIHKHNKSIELFRQKLHEKILFELPQVNKITKNKWLNLPQLQELLIDLSNYYCEILSESQNTKNQKHYYHLWIYTLLALHQSHASYTNFQALASINACIELQFKKHVKNISRNMDFDKQSLQNSITQWLTTLMILKQVFKQHFLGKYLKLLKDMQML